MSRGDFFVKLNPKMEIKYFGDSFFRIKGKKAVLVTNPRKKISADIVLLSRYKDPQFRPEMVKAAIHREDPFIIDVPGEYEISGVFVLGIKKRETNFFIIEMEELRLVYFGGEISKLNEKEIEEINGSDIFLIPPTMVGEIDQFEPKIVILQEEYPREIEPLPKLTITKEILPKERQVVVLNAGD